MLDCLFDGQGYTAPSMAVLNCTISLTHALRRAWLVGSILHRCFSSIEWDPSASVVPVASHRDLQLLVLDADFVSEPYS